MQALDTAERERAVAPAESPVASEADTTFALTPPHSAASMHVTKRNGGQEAVDVNKIVRAVTRSAEGLHGVDPLRVVLKTIGGLYDGATTAELDQLSIRTAAALTAEEPEYGQLAARLLGAYIDKEVSGREIQSYSQSIARGAELGILNDRLRDFVGANARKLNDAIDPLATRRFEYFGLRTVYDRYLLRHPQKRLAIETIPSIRQKGAFCFKWIDSIQDLHRLQTREHRRQFLLNLICFAACIEGLFFYAAFAYVYYLRSRGLLHGLAAGTNWVFRDESGHMAFVFEVVRTVRAQEPELFDDAMRAQVEAMMEEAIACETQFAKDVLSGGVAGMSVKDMRQYLEYCADQRLAQLDLPKQYGAKNPFDFMDLQDVQELANFFERRVSAYQVGVQGKVAFDLAF